MYGGVFALGQAQGHFTLDDSPRLLATNMVAMEDGYQMEILAGRRTRTEMIGNLRAYARAVTGHDPSPEKPHREGPPAIHGEEVK